MRWITLVFALAMALACSSSNGGGMGGAGSTGGAGGSAEGGSGGKTVANGGSGGSGGTLSRQVEFPFGGCKPVAEAMEIATALLPETDPHCNEWVDMPPLEVDEDGEVRLGSANASRGLAAEGCLVAYASGADVYLYDLATNRERLVSGWIGTAHSIAMHHGLLLFDRLDCDDTSCEHSLEIQDVTTCSRGRFGVRSRDSDVTWGYRSLIVSGTRAIWSELQDRGCNRIAMLDLSTGESRFLTELDGACHAGPGLAGDWLTWEKNAQRKIVMLRNLKTGEERELTPEGEFYLYPETDGRYVVYSRGERSLSDLYAYEIATGKVTPVVEVPGDQTEAYLFDGKVSWTDLRDSSREYYGYTAAYYEKELPDGEEQLLRPALTPIIYGRRVGEGLVWIDARTQRPTLWAKPKL